MKYKTIIPTFRENRQLNKCLAWLKSVNKLDSVIVINDNKPSSELKVNFDVDIIHTGGDYWWSGSTNTGIKEAIKQNCECVILFNSDNWGESDVIQKLLEKFKTNKSIVHAATVLNQENIVRCTAGVLNTDNYQVKMFNHGKNKSDLRQGCYFGNYNGGMGVLIPISVFKRTGFLDETFPLSADREFYYRAFTHGIPVCAYEDITIYTDDTHKAIDRGYISTNRFVRKVADPFNFRSPIYYKTIFKFYRKHSSSPRINTLKVMLNYFYGRKNNPLHQT